MMRRTALPRSFTVFSYNVLAQPLLRANVHYAAAPAGESAPFFVEEKYRAARVASCLRSAAGNNDSLPDLVCLQEVTHASLAVIEPAMSPLLCSCRPDATSSSSAQHFVATLFNPARFELIDSDTLLRAETAPFALITRLRLRDSAQGTGERRQLTLCNVHLDYRQNGGRFQASELARCLRAMLPLADAPCVIAGDFNFEYSRDEQLFRWLADERDVHAFARSLRRVRFDAEQLVENDDGDVGLSECLVASARTSGGPRWVDNVYFSPPPRLRLLQKSLLPFKRDVPHIACSETNPSDHAMIGVRFAC